MRYPAGWQRTLAIMFLAQMLSATGFSLIFPFLPLYVQSLGSATGASVELLSGLVFSAQAFTMAIASPFWGSMADRLGRKLMVERAMFGGAIILGLMAFAQSAEQLVLLRAIQGFITGTIAAANALVAAEAPRERMGFAMGLLQVAMWTGVAVGPVLGGTLADLYGFQAPFLITALLLAMAGVVVWRGVDERFHPVERTRTGLGGLLSQWGCILARRNLSVTYTMRFVGLLGTNMIWPIIPLFVQMLMPAATHVGKITGLIVGMSSAAGTIGAIYLGRKGDKVGQRNVLILTALAGAILLAPQSLVTSVWQLLMLQVAAGLVLGGMAPLLSALLARYSDRGTEGTVYGLDNSVNSAARAVAPMVGTAVAFWFSMRATFLAASASMALAALLAWLLLPKESER